jgi:hypothetical protein
MTYTSTPTEHITIDEEFAVFRGKCPFRVFIKSKPGKYGIKLWVAADAKKFYACNMQKKQGLLVVKDMVCHTYGAGRGVTIDNFFTSCELANFLLSKNMTAVGTLRKNRPETKEMSFLPSLVLPMI